MDKTRWDQLESAFREFDSQNPSVWMHFVLFTFDRIAKGFKRYSAKEIIHRVKWETSTVGKNGSKQGLKIGNNHISFYARKFRLLYPEHKDFFILCSQPSLFQRPLESEVETAQSPDSEDSVMVDRTNSGEEKLGEWPLAIRTRF